VNEEKKEGGGIVCMLHFDRLGQAQLYNFMNLKKTLRPLTRKKNREKNIKNDASLNREQQKKQKLNSRSFLKN
jgi:hypothetical protein